MKELTKSIELNRNFFDGNNIDDGVITMSDEYDQRMQIQSLEDKSVNRLISIRSKNEVYFNDGVRRTKDLELEFKKDFGQEWKKYTFDELTRISRKRVGRCDPFNPKHCMLFRVTSAGISRIFTLDLYERLYEWLMVSDFCLELERATGHKQFKDFSNIPTLTGFCAYEGFGYQNFVFYISQMPVLKQIYKIGQAGVIDMLVAGMQNGSINNIIGMRHLARLSKEWADVSEEIGGDDVGETDLNIFKDKTKEEIIAIAKGQITKPEEKDIIDGVIESLNNNPLEDE